MKVIRKIDTLTEALEVESQCNEFQDVMVTWKDSKIRGLTHRQLIRSNSNTTNEYKFIHAELVEYPYPRNLRGEALVNWCAQNGVVLNATEVHDIGFRAGERSGYASEKMPDGTFEAVKYGPAGHADGKYPYGTKRTVLSTG